LNFQFCGALINYDMPWNPMRVEQRIGRIDRFGQEHAKIRVTNLHYTGHR
jgi:SNF2 family DNA or RNA helicase